MSNYYPVQPQTSMSKGKHNASETPFAPTAATASLFLYSEGSTVICLHHDSLAVAMKFEKHAEEVQFICVDNVSERGAGRLVVTYDASRTAIVWDLFTGEQISRFASYEPLTVAAWMRNGNLAFGNEKGEVILFEPATNEHVSARTIFDPITAIAPSADCKTYAIGYRNGSILLASLQPLFTILHTLTTARAPSPITGLTWHASSSKQKSDMLATHTDDGDLRVWSVAKPPTNTTPRVIRNLKQPEAYISNRNWISWSKNGRILQHSDGAIWAWDVRTKDVTYEVIPTTDSVQGIAAFGPTGTFFTLSADNTVQQYDVDSAQMLHNVQQAPISIPQTPPQEISMPVFTSDSEPEMTAPGSQSRLDAYAAETAKIDMKRSTTPRSSHTRDQSGTSSSRAAQTFSPASKTERTTTTISLGPPSSAPREAFSPASNKSGRKGSRLRQEVLMSPEERPVPELFPYIRARLSDVPYRQSRNANESHMTPDDLRRQMLSVVFGWDDDIQPLISDELSRNPVESAHAVYLTRWLNKDADEVADAINAPGSNPTLNWMRLALNSIGDSLASKKIAQGSVEQMLLQGDVHAAVAILIACGDWNDAVEVYVSRSHHMEAVLLACLLMPTEWQRLSFLVLKWAEMAVSKGDQHLALRCFSCTGGESSDPWTSPGAQIATGMTSPQQAPTLQPSIFHKTMERRGLPSPTAIPPLQQEPEMTFAAQNNLQESSGLKLITSFGGKDHYRFPGLMSDEGTPINAALVTPIAESAAPRSALSPGGYGTYRANNMRSLNSALAGKPSTPANSRGNRLPSIGEAASDIESSRGPQGLASRAPPTPADSGSDKERERFKQPLMDPVKIREELPLLLTPARYEPPPSRTAETPQTAVATKHTNAYGERIEEPVPSTVKRNSSRTRKPDGLSIKMFPTRESQPEHDQSAPVAYEDPIDRPSTTETMNSMDNPDFTSPPHTGNSYSSYRSLKSPSVSGRSLDQYISSLEQAQYYKSRPRGNSMTGKQTKEDSGDRKKNKYRDQVLEDARGRNDVRGSHNQKRSPSSPVPMSPGELRLYTGSVESLDSTYLSGLSANPSDYSYLQSESRASTTTPGDRRKHRSRSRPQSERKTRNSSRTASRRRSPDGLRSQRGRSKSRHEEPAMRSPSSPEPLQASEDDGNSVSSVDPALRIVSQNRSRLHSQSGRRQERSASTQRKPSPEGRSSRMRSSSRQPEGSERSTRKSSVGVSGDRSRRRAESSVDVQRDVRDKVMAEQRPGSSKPDFERPKQNTSPFIMVNRRTKELAQAELEARRLSLQRRPSAPAVPLPGQDAYHNKASSMDFAPPLLRAQTDSYTTTLATMSANPILNENSNGFVRRSTTPRAMNHPGHSRNNSVPDLPNVEVLANDVYRPPKMPNTSTASPIRKKGDVFENPDIPLDMPTHPAFDSNIGGSRPSSRNVLSGRHASPARAASRDRDRDRDRSRQRPSEIQVMTIGEENYAYEQQANTRTVVPELQHLAVPPPPPPPPAPPKDFQSFGALRIQTNDLSGMPANIPLPASAYPGETVSTQSPANATEARHRRGRSGSENQIVGKIRNFAGRMRSNSRGRSASQQRGDNTRSPPTGTDEQYSPYESLPNPHSQMAHRELATVLEGR